MPPNAKARQTMAKVLATAKATRMSFVHAKPNAISTYEKPLSDSKSGAAKAVGGE
jgi:hypothetical protein